MYRPVGTSRMTASSSQLSHSRPTTSIASLASSYSSSLAATLRRGDVLGDVERLGVSGGDGRDQTDRRCRGSDPGHRQQGIQLPTHVVFSFGLQTERVIECDEVEQPTFGETCHLDGMICREEPLEHRARFTPGGRVLSGAVDADADVHVRVNHATSLVGGGPAGHVAILANPTK